MNKFLLALISGFLYCISVCAQSFIFAPIPITDHDNLPVENATPANAESVSLYTADYIALNSFLQDNTGDNVQFVVGSETIELSNTTKLEVNPSVFVDSGSGVETVEAEFKTNYWGG